jgi:hypothetical protein
MKNWKGLGRKWPWPNNSTLLGFGLRKIVKLLSQNSHHPGQDLNLAPLNTSLNTTSRPACLVTNRERYRLSFEFHEVLCSTELIGVHCAMMGQIPWRRVITLAPLKKFHENIYRKIDRNLLYYRDRMSWPSCSDLDDYWLVEWKGKYTALTFTKIIYTRMHFVLLTFTVVLGALNYFGYIIAVSIKLENMNIFKISFFHLQHTIHNFHWMASEIVLPTHSAPRVLNSSLCNSDAIHFNFFFYMYFRGTLSNLVNL